MEILLITIIILSIAGLCINAKKRVGGAIIACIHVCTLCTPSPDDKFNVKKENTAIIFPPSETKLFENETAK